MKKIFAAILSVALLFCGCSISKGNNDTENNAESTTNETTNTAETTLEATGLGVILSDYDTNAIVWGPGNIQNHERPVDPEKLQSQYSDLNGKWLLADDKNICLTFDEGYENGYTAQILDTLKEKNVKAIFFCTYDYVKDNPELVNRMINEGHIVGNHSYRHYNFTQIDVETARDEITILHDYVAEQFGYEMKYFRFPEGAFSAQALALTKDLGYSTLFWSFAYADWDRENPPSNETAFEKITSSVHNGAILLLHAVCKSNAEVLGDAIDNIIEQGYTFTTSI
ncbi:MAG: polysaccharide deacetylase family protein [Eubacterium sp.]|nr:polysaccharide deacetylase family protein [Eubacterium sp.]